MNGKVRIYELSRELNLDNKEILDVCEQLSIPVKSHSSTISEAEAARIRSAAEKYVHTSPPSGKSTSTHSMPPSKPSGAQPPVKKQQILEVRRHRPVVEAPRRPEAAQPSVDAASQQIAQPTSPPARPSATRPGVTAAPELEREVDSRAEVIEPVKAPVTGSVETAPSVAEPLPAAAPEVAADLQPTEPQSQASLESSAVETTSQPQVPVSDRALETPAGSKPARAIAIAADAPPLAGPPTKPATRSEASSAAGRPVLKKAGSANRSEPAPTRSASEGQGIIRRSPAARAEMTASGHIPITEMSESPVLRAKPVIELRHKPVRATTEG